MVVVGHSFGCCGRPAAGGGRPELVAGLVLLDPAVGLDGGWMREIAEAMLASPDYTDAAEARDGKGGGAWSDVEPAVLDAEVDEHLIDLPDGRVGWRVSMPAMMSYWSELARDITLPPTELRSPLVRAKRTTPPYVTDALIDGLARACWRGFPAAGLRLQPHGAARQTRRDRRADPRAAGSCCTVPPVTDEQVERVRATGRRDSVRPGRHLRRHRHCRRAFQPAHRRLDHADRFLGSALAPGDLRIGPTRPRTWRPGNWSCCAPKACWPTTAEFRCARFATSSDVRNYSASRTSAAVRARPGNAAAVERGCSA